MKKLYSILEGIFDIDDKLDDNSVDLALGKYLSRFSGITDAVNCELNGHKLSIGPEKDQHLVFVDAEFFEAARETGVKEIIFSGGTIIGSEEASPTIIKNLKITAEKNIEFHGDVVIENSTLRGNQIRFWRDSASIASGVGLSVTLKNSKIYGESTFMSIYFRRVSNLNIDNRTKFEGSNIVFCYDAWYTSPSLIKGTVIGDWVENQGVIKFTKNNGVKWLQKDPKNFKIHCEDFPYNIKIDCIRIDINKANRTDTFFWSKKSKFKPNWETDAGWNFGYKII